MASDSTLGGGLPSPTSSSSSAFGALPAFFTNGSVDDAKYESLLADLRAHDLLGPVDAQADAPGHSSGFGAHGSGASSSLFFNDAFSAVFMGNFSDETSSSTAFSAGSAKPAGSKPPPGFTSAPPGLAPSETDLKWARGQQEFSRLEEQFHSHGAGSATPGAAPAAAERAAASPEKESDLQIDESQIPSLRSLGLDDDDTPAVPSAPVPAAPQPPHQPPQPPMAWQQHQQHQQHQQQQQQQQYQQPPMPPHMNVGGHNQPPLPPPPGAWNQHQHHPNGPRPPYPPPPMGAGPPHQLRGPMPPPPFMHGQYPPMPPPPHGMPYPPPPPPFYMGGPPPPPPFGRGGPPPGPVFKMMTPRDVNFVVQQQMKQIRTSDPFSDDYYFHNYSQKRSRGGAPSAGPAAPGARPGLPLPSWKLEHVKSFDPRDAQRENKSRTWEQEYHVLGRNTKSSLYRPKQMLNLGGSSSSSSANTLAGDHAEPKQAVSATGESSSGAEADDDKAKQATPPPSSSSEQHVLRMSQDASRNSVFANDTWHRRQQIDRGMQCLLSLQDARHILDARGVNVQQFHSMGEQEMDPALAELRARTTALLLELAGLLGVSVTTNEQVEQPSGVMSCDVAQLFTMLDTSKGRKLVSRSLPLLHPSARFVLLPLVVEHMLGARTVSRLSHANALADESDDRLCQALVLIILFHPPAPSAELLAECLQRALAGHDVQTLAVVLHNRSRAEALQALLQRGGAAIQQLSGEGEGESDRYRAVKGRWEHTQGVFVSLATAIKQSA